jgi:signal transduction histidine kinase
LAEAMRVMRDFRLGAALLGAELVLSGIYFLFPAGGTVQFVLYGIFGGASVLSIAFGIRRYRPRPVLPWVVFETGVLAFVIGDVLLDIYTNWTTPSPADWFYLAAYPMFAATVVMLIVSTGTHRRVGAVVDALVVTLAFALFEWVFVMAPALAASGPLGPRVVLGVLYPAMDIVLIGAAVGYFVSPNWRTPAFALLLVGLLTQLVGDTAVGLAAPSFSVGSWSDWPFMASYIFWGAAALHPSMRELGRPPTNVETRVSRLRVFVLGCALLSFPAVRVIADVRHKPVGVWVVAALSALVAIVVIGRMSGMLGSLDRARKQLTGQNEELRRADRLKDEFIALVSHDLRTPLTSIIGYVELALDEDGAAPLDDERRRYLEVVARSSDRLLRLVDDLLLAARLQSGRFVLNVEDADLAATAAEALDEMHARAERKNVSLFLASDGPIRIECDRRRLLQLLDNLIGNAVKFTPEGGRIELRVERTLDGAAMEVHDTGVGIAPGEEERIFDRFYRSPTAVADQVPGTGLGLFIARAVAERHGGTLVARRRDGGGSVFRVELPARAPKPTEDPEPELVA